MHEEYFGTKRIGHILKSHLPLSLFKWMLKCYHVCKSIHAHFVEKRVMAGVESRIIQIRKTDSPIRFGFYVVLDSMFQFKHVYELMLSDKRFDPFIVIAPRISWGEKDMIETQESTYKSLVKEFGEERIYKGYLNGRFENRMAQCDACAMMNVYAGLTESSFETEHFAAHNVPIFSSQYGCSIGTSQTPEYYRMPSLRFVRRFFCSNLAELMYFNKYRRLKDGNDVAKITGCPKADVIKYGASERTQGKITILIAPHHSVIPSVDSDICIGNFIRYKDLFLKLPKRYPRVHWIFRPHPHLKLRLVKDVGWTEAIWDDYIGAWTENGNAEYESGGGYYKSFARSDAIIHDCGSFLVEYFYTGKPHCYMLASEKAKAAQFDEWGQELLSHTYQAFDENAIIRFIEDVVIAGNDTMKVMRQKFAKERVMINYPHASEAIVEDIAELLGRGRKA